MHTSTTHLVHASELGAHAYCARSHWLAQSVGEARSQEREAVLQAGTAAHETHARTAQLAERATSWAATLGALAAIVLLLLFLLGASYPHQTVSLPSLTPAQSGAVALAAAALGAAAIAAAARRQSQMPAGTRIIATDAGSEKGPYLVDHSAGIAGRPDYIIREGTHLVALETKPKRRSNRLYESDRLQAIAYGMLLQHAEPRHAAPYARVSYADRSFVVPIDDRARTECLRAATEIRRNRMSSDVPRNHSSAARCRGCDFRTSCAQALA
jgi:CRISPR/Cas system-associated exonuclease Cas4 (RecB family)